MNNNKGGRLLILFVLLYVAVLLLLSHFNKLPDAAVSAVVVILIGLGAVGTLVGLFHSFCCFMEAFICKHNEIRVRNEEIDFTEDDIPKNGDGSYKYYEECAEPGYFNKQLLKDIGSAIGNSWKNIIETVKYTWSCKFDSYGFWRLIDCLKALLTIVCVLTFGAAISGVLSLAILMLFLILILIYKLFAAVCMGVEILDFKLKHVSYRCDKCKEEYSLPVYICPVCGVPHMKLRPTKFGIFHRRCLCGTVLPCTAVTKTADKQKRSDLTARCPYCGRSDRAKMSRPLGVALIGGVAAGKTTFKTAFLYKFINEDAIRYGLKTSFPDKDTEFLFEEAEKSFKGIRPIPATKPGQEYDVSSFNFFISNNKFDVDRYVHLYDMPGEVFETINSKERLKHFSFSEGVVFIIDPYSMKSVIDYSDELGDMSIGKMNIDSLMQVFLETLDGLQGMRREGGKYTLPVAVAINKVDTIHLKELLGEPAIKKLRKTDPSFYANKYDAMDLLCRAFLISNGKSNAVTLLDQNFKYVHFFSCSSMGYMPKGALARFEPENVVAAVQWILTRSDYQLSAIWKDEGIGDISETKKKQIKERIGDYDKYIAGDFKI
ncbi:MAG: ATP/GTP-binding protein [Ruminococcus sp.]|nr:ATP/GTP-binding protein [Ruminococcus sp.]